MTRWVLMLLVLVMLLAGCGSETQVAADTTQRTATTAAAPATTTTLPPTTTTSSTTTTEAPTTTDLMLTQEMAFTAFGAWIDDLAPKLIDILKEHPGLEAVKSLGWDADAQRVVLILASTYTGQDDLDMVEIFYDPQAWGLTQATAAGWGSTAVEAMRGNALPPFRLELDGLVYEVSGEVMAGISDKEVSMEDWLAACGR